MPRTTTDILAIHRALLDAINRADALANHADAIGDLSFAYHVGRVQLAALDGLHALHEARAVDQG